MHVPCVGINRNTWKETHQIEYEGSVCIDIVFDIYEDMSRKNAEW